MEKLTNSSQTSGTTMGSFVSNANPQDWTPLVTKYEPQDPDLLKKYELLNVLYDEPLSATTVTLVQNTETGEVCLRRRHRLVRRADSRAEAGAKGEAVHGVRKKRVAARVHDPC